jgi:hypothetical protein
MPDELERGDVVVRDMARREERRVPLETYLADPAQA